MNETKRMVSSMLLGLFGSLILVLSISLFVDVAKGETDDLSTGTALVLSLIVFSLGAALLVAARLLWRRRSGR